MSTEEAPQSTLPYPPVHKDKKFVVLSDWDGTITNLDSNDWMIDHLGFGRERRRELMHGMLDHTTTFRDGFREMLESVSANGHKLPDCQEKLRENIKLDVGFRDFYHWCKGHDIPVIIVSSGMTPVIRAVLSKLLGDEANEIEIISNEVEIKEDGKWEIKYRHPTSGFGHDKSQAILQYTRLPNPPTLFFFGDGVSDMSAARHANVLFVKTVEGGDNDLAAYCRKENLPHVPVSDFGAALPIVQSIVKGEKTVGDVMGVKA